MLQYSHRTVTVTVTVTVTHTTLNQQMHCYYCLDVIHYNIKMDLQEVGWEGVDWIDLAQDRDRWRALVSAVMNLRVP